MGCEIWGSRPLAIIDANGDTAQSHDQWIWNYTLYMSGTGPKVEPSSDMELTKEINNYKKTEMLW